MAYRRRFVQLSRALAAPIVLAIALAGGASATVPDGGPRDLTPAEMQTWLDGGSHARMPPASLGPFNYVHEFDQMVGFLATWQLLDPDSSAYGGMIEAESGSLRGVIQTDNTLEAIWCWSRYRQFSGRTTHDANVAAAWVYCQNFPAWMEEGGVGDDYYRVHNCAWGLTAVLQYEAATGDLTFSPYADACAQYIVTHPLVISDGTIWQQRLDSFVKGWAAGNLYLFAQARGNPTQMAQAVTQGTDVYNWLNSNPSLNLTLEYWAMSSGTALWGVCNSVFRNNPGLGASWLATNGGFMDTWQEWYNAPGFDWDGAWNVGFCNGHFAAYDVTGSGGFLTNGRNSANNLLSLDTDDDGGIMAQTVSPDTEDMSWVTCYLIKFGVDRLMGTPAAHDTGVLRFEDLADGDEIPLGTPIAVRAMATNFGLSAETAVPVHLSGDAGTADAVVDLPFAALTPVTLLAAWTPASTGTYTLTAVTQLGGDLVAGNDGATVTIHVVEPVGVPGAGDVFAAAPRVLENPSRTGAAFEITTREATAVTLRIFDLLGRHVFTTEGRTVGPGALTLSWDGRSARAIDAPPGVYVYGIQAGPVVRTGKLVRVP